MTRIRLAYVHGFVDRHGKPRYYLRRPGFKRVPLPGLPGSSEFMEAYQTALSATPRVEIGAARTKPGTVAAAVASYFNSTAFGSLSDGTRRGRRAILERFRESHGEKRIALLQRGHLDKMIAEKKGAAAKHFLKALRGLLKHCVAEGVRSDDPTRDIKLQAPKTGGYHTWTEDDISAFEARHPIGTRARLALGLLLYTAQRRGDVVRLGRQHVRDGALHVRQGKTGVHLSIPLHPALVEILDLTPSVHLTFLVTSYGKPFSAWGFGNWFREVCDAAGLKHCSAHGLRKAACRRLAEAGCSANVIAAISGHMTLREVERYTKAADQVRMAKAGMATVTEAFPARARTSSGKPQ